MSKKAQTIPAVPLTRQRVGRETHVEKPSARSESNGSFGHHALRRAEEEMTTGSGSHPWKSSSWGKSPSDPAKLKPPKRQPRKKRPIRRTGRGDRRRR